MLETDEDAVVCDLAETYGVFDYQALPVPLAATLAAGLNEDARIMLKMHGEAYSFRTTALAAIIDALNMLVWMQSEDAKHNRNRPKSVVQAMKDAVKPRDIVSFDSGEAFMRERRKYFKGGDA